MTSARVTRDDLVRLIRQAVGMRLVNENYFTKAELQELLAWIEKAKKADPDESSR